MKFIGVDGSPQLLQLVLALQPRPTLFHDLPRSDVVVQSPQDSPLLQPRAPPLNLTWQKLLRSDLLFPLRTPLALISNTSAPCPIPPVTCSTFARSSDSTSSLGGHRRTFTRRSLRYFGPLFLSACPPFLPPRAVTHQRLLPPSGSFRHFPLFMLIFET